MQLKVRVEGRAVLIERVFADGQTTTGVMPMLNAGQAEIKGEQLATLFGLTKVETNQWEKKNG